jgi:hypothetical protein
MRLPPMTAALFPGYLLFFVASNQLVLLVNSNKRRNDSGIIQLFNENCNDLNCDDATPNHAARSQSLAVKTAHKYRCTVIIMHNQHWPLESKIEN